MSKRKHIPQDQLPPRPDSTTRIILPIRDETFTEELLRTTRDHVDRALKEITRARMDLPGLDKHVVLYSDYEKDPLSIHRISLAELNTLLAEFSAIMDQAYSQKKPSKKTRRALKSVKRNGHRRLQGLPSVARNAHHHHQHPRSYSVTHYSQRNTKPAAQLIRRAELHEVGKEME